MSALTSLQTSPVLSRDVAVPGWVDRLLTSAVSREISVGGTTINLRQSAEFSCASVSMAKARFLPATLLSEKIYQTYSAIAQVLGDSPASHPVRFWNHLCGIHDDMGGGMDRYMAFNVGRYRAFEQWLGGAGQFDQHMATASGVGCSGDDIVIHAFAANREGIAVSNPRQVQPFKYSQRYGPYPPCFARATILPLEKPLFLIGGTASIRGEESVHLGDVSGQLAETFENIGALLTHAGQLLSRPATLANLTELRIYITDPKLADAIFQGTLQFVPAAKKLQFVQADICRRELLVEIEALAEL